MPPLGIAGPLSSEFCLRALPSSIARTVCRVHSTKNSLPLHSFLHFTNMIWNLSDLRSSLRKDATWIKRNRKQGRRHALENTLDCLKSSLKSWKLKKDCGLFKRARATSYEKGLELLRQTMLDCMQALRDTPVQAPDKWNGKECGCDHCTEYRSQHADQVASQ
jgi:hypothetical protein